MALFLSLLVLELGIVFKLANGILGIAVGFGNEEPCDALAFITDVCGRGRDDEDVAVAKVRRTFFNSCGSDVFGFFERYREQGNNLEGGR